MVWLISGCLFSASVIATEPQWLQQVAANKRQQPEAMLALFNQHQAELPALSAEDRAAARYQQAALLGILGRHQEQQQAAEQGLAELADSTLLLKVKLLYELGFAREMQTDYPAALQYYLDGITLATHLENEKYILYGQINHAAILSNRNNMQQALALLKDTYQRAQLLNDAEVTAEVMSELGLLYASLAYEQEAISLLKQALAAYEKLGWQKEQITVLFNLARTYSYMEQYQLALQTYNEMLQKSLQVQDQVNLYHAYLGLAIASSDSGRADAALSYIAKAEQYLPQLQSRSHLSTHHFEKAQIFQKLKQTSLAMQQVMLAEQRLTEEGVEADSPTRLNVWYLKAKLQAEQGEYDKAYQTLHEFIFVFQDARNKENELAFEQLRLAFDQERQQQQTRLLEQDNELKALRLSEAEREQKIQILWLAILGCSTLILLVLLLWQLTRRKQKFLNQAADSAGQQDNA
ncbi:MAG: tetratricopeptide repeat protein [Gammaproteobacteria bacterium]|nr:tetratricopeptide repeat protein [Gammaproteobacteria bacterium]MBU1553252.1 tetratricopeptide repeat protein [Gammaproteobacteria bacterium]MBU2069009.1 tetratricopeptide repeat protein [Gammaproteobacteria bacterium]MBU2183232.1 tetratricopeptide repeat protein [Gammaproteobacteria bacterium]MBU2204612.1 tetratricopeptide repeat protein [Gammaproteobacteria bacterium]